MAYKIFPVCLDGDQFSISFDYQEERLAFEVVSKNIDTLLKDKLTGAVDETVTSADIFRTTLQREVAERHFEAIKRIFNLHVLNIYKDATRIIRYG